MLGPEEALVEVERSIVAAWDAYLDEEADATDEAAARAVIADPSLHPWRVVDAALSRLRCPACSTPLGSAERGCGPCDEADGFRFAAREPDRPGVPPGNEHAIRVSSAVLRAPRRYPAWSVTANRWHLPLFLAGGMPTRREQEAMLAAWRGGLAVDASGATSFTELAARATTAVAASRGR